jgi:arylsulfatase
MYDLVTRVPMVVWAPNLYKGGRSIEGLCQHMDIGPAILEMAGIEVPQNFEAQSILPAIQGKEWKPRDYVYAEQIKDGILTETDFMSMIRNEEWKLVHFLHMKCGQLFNLKEDPNEVRNLWDDPRAKVEKQNLLDQLREWHIESQIHTHDWAAEWR